MGAVGKTPNGFKFIRISSHTPKNIQEGSAEIISEGIDILSNPSWTCLGPPQQGLRSIFSACQAGVYEVLCFWKSSQFLQNKNTIKDKHST